MKPSSSQFPTSNVRVIPKENVDTSKMEPVDKRHDDDNDYDSANPVDRESVNLAYRNQGTQHQTAAWAQRIVGPSGEGHDDTYRAQAMIYPSKTKVGPKKVSGIGEGKTIEEARNKAFNNASDARIKSTQGVADRIKRQDEYNTKYNKSKRNVIKINSGKAK